jgi:ABC-type nitrate/sulfonate/bicarbonate transport system substrate-binding protein
VRKMSRGTAPKRMLQAIAAVVAAAGFLAVPAAAQVNKSGAGGLAPPSNGSFMVPIIQKLGLDKKNGLDFDINLYSDPSTLYSDFASGRTTHIFGAFFNGANFYVRGMKVRLLFTVSTANHSFATKDPAIRAPEDLKGKTIAATTSSGFYGMAVLFLRQHGLDPRSNISIINASPAAVQTQLLAGRTDVGLMADPGLSNLVMNGFHLVGDMKDGIRKELKMPADAPIWYIGAYAQADWVDENPGRAAATMKMWQEAAAFYNDKPDEADEIISAFTKLPVEALKTSRKLGLTKFKVEPAIDQKGNLDKLFEGFKSVGFLTAVPDDGIYYKWKK